MENSKPKLVKISEKAQNSCAWSPSDALEDALKDISEKNRDPSDSLVILLDRRDGKYKINWYIAGMSISEVIALLEISKQEFFKEMGF